MLRLVGKTVRDCCPRGGALADGQGDPIMVDEPLRPAPMPEDPQDPKKTALGGRLRTARLQAGLTQEELAARVGRKKNWLSDIERGRRGIDPHTLQEIADETGRPVEYFTNPNYDAERRRQLHRPATREDWELLYAGDPERAAAHASLDEAFDRAATLLEGEGAGGGGNGGGGNGDGEPEREPPANLGAHAGAGA